MPLLRTFNPKIAQQLARLATIASDEEAYWQGEMDRLLAGLLLPGLPTRGGGRSNSTRPQEDIVAIEHTRLRDLQPAVARRVIRAAARRLGASLSFDHTEQLLALASRGGPGRANESPVGPSAGSGSRAGSRFDLPGGLTVERSLRELRLGRGPVPAKSSIQYPFAIPGEVTAPEYRLRLLAESADSTPATLRPWKPGDRVTIRHSRGPKKVAEILDRLHIVGSDRQNWPVVEAHGKIVWMQGVDVDAPEFRITAQPLP